MTPPAPISTLNSSGPVLTHVNSSTFNLCPHTSCFPPHWVITVLSFLSMNGHINISILHPSLRIFGILSLFHMLCLAKDDLGFLILQLLSLSFRTVYLVLPSLVWDDAWDQTQGFMHSRRAHHQLSYILSFSISSHCPFHLLSTQQLQLSHIVSWLSSGTNSMSQSMKDKCAADLQGDAAGTEYLEIKESLLQLRDWKKRLGLAISERLSQGVESVCTDCSLCPTHWLTCFKLQDSELADSNSKALLNIWVILHPHFISVSPGYSHHPRNIIGSLSTKQRPLLWGRSMLSVCLFSSHV